MTTPRIAIPVPTTFDQQYNRVNWPAYAEAIRQAGGEPVPLTPGVGSRSELESLDGVLLTGSPADVNPDGYGHSRDEQTAQPDPAREALDRLLLGDASRTGKPLLAVCFGLQMLNTFYGGTLVQDLSALPVNHSAGPSVAVAHAVVMSAASRLCRMANAEECSVADSGLRLPVNSSHHQAVGIVGTGLVVSARCPQDHVVEAVELAPEAGGWERFLIGVQWHPERNTQTSATSRTLMSTLVGQAQAWRARRSS